MIETPVQGRKLLEVAKRVRARMLESGKGQPGRYPTDAELAVMIQAEVEEAREAHRERMRVYYRQRRAAALEGRRPAPAAKRTATGRGRKSRAASAE